MFLPNKAQDQKEHTLSVWLHAQRIDYGGGKLIPAKNHNRTMSSWAGGKADRDAVRTVERSPRTLDMPE